MGRVVSMPTLLVVDDEPGICRAFEQAFSATYRVVSLPSAEDALQRLDELKPDLILLDVGLPGMSGLDFLARLKSRPEAPPVIVITAQGSMNTAVEAMKLGARELVLKPVDLDLIQIHVDRALERVRLSAEVARLKGQAGLAGEHDLVGNSPLMQEVYKRLGAAARSEVPVLVTGESGTGKELAARAIHAHSGRSGGPFVAVNCAAVTPGLLESELFGHEKGAFTGAVSQRLGRFESAHGGTLFLDEIGEMPPATQVALLRVLETRAFERVGGSETVRVDVRVVAATNGDLRSRIADGRFREDLYYRLNGLAIHMPPLRDRAEDIPLLVARLLQSKSVSQEALQVLQRHRWPGNVRELRQALDQAAALAPGDILLPAHLPAAAPPPSGSEAAKPGMPGLDAWLDGFLAQDRSEGLYERVLDALEKPLLSRVMAQTAGNQVQASRRLGIHRTTLRTKLEKHGLSKPEKPAS